jgi:hypothetical protein
MHSIVAKNKLKIIPVFLNINLTTTLFSKQLVAGLEDKFIGKPSAFWSGAPPSRSSPQRPTGGTQEDAYCPRLYFKSLFCKVTNGILVNDAINCCVA